MPIQAARRFATDTGKISVIGALTDAAVILAGQAGTQIASERNPRDLPSRTSYSQPNDE
jgi:hypothetical protein